LANGASTTISFNVSPTATGTLTNTATVTGTNNTNTTTNSSTVITTVGAVQNVNVQLSLQGNALGTVTDTTGAINCTHANTNTTSCSALFPVGGQVTLTESTLGAFGGWIGAPTACTVSGNTCQFTVPATGEQITATFNPGAATFSLTVSPGPNDTGSGTVTSAPVGINCTVAPAGVSGACSAILQVGTLVNMTVTPAAGSNFFGWTGTNPNCLSSSAVNCEVAITQNENVVPTFTSTQQQFLLTVGIAGAGSGTVTSQAGLAPAINCTTGSAVGCSANYNANTNVVLTAAPAAGSTFTGWSGGTPACSGIGTCSVTMSQAQNVTATFGQAVQQFPLTVTDAGTGTGTVKSQPGLVPAISCTTGTADGCTGSYNSGTPVTLTATAGNGSAFAGWSGGTPACSGTGTCSVTMSQAQNVTATFNTSATLQSIAISPSAPSIPTGQTVQLFAIGMFSDGSQSDLTNSVTWASDTPGVATVSNAAGSQGLVAGVAGGTATISAKLGSITGSTLVTVAQFPTMVPPQLFFTEGTIGTQTAAQTTTFTNPGPNAIQISGVTITGSFLADFGQTSDCGTVSGPGTCPISTKFTPSTLGPETADVSVASNSPFSPTVAHVVGNSTNRQLPGFLTNVLPANDDNSTGAVPLPFPINFFGTTYNSLFVNNNGNVTFGQPLGTFTPTGLNGDNGGIPIMAPFWADVDTTGLGSSVVTYGTDTVNGHQAFGVNYQNVGYFASNFDKLNSFQLVLIDRSDTGAGNFDMEFNYNEIRWEAGDASGGTLGLCGALVPPACVPAAAGYSNGTGNPGTNFQLAGSFVPGALLDSGPAATSLIRNSVNTDPVLGRYVFAVRNGAVQADTLTLTLAGTGTGTVKDNAGQLTCSDTNGGQKVCNANYPSGTQLILTATADPGSNFSGWSAPCAGTGTCAFTITQNTGITATFTPANVTLQSITVAPPTPSIVAGTNQAFTATGHFSDGSSGPVSVTWSSSNTAIATINASTGVATGVTAGGPITITATSTQNQNINGTAQLTVTAPVVLVSIAVTPANPSVIVGQNQQFTATGTFSDNSQQDITASVVWSSSNPDVASITAGGLATGLTGGANTTISASKAVGNTIIKGSTTLTVTNVPFVLAITPPPGGNPGAPPTVTPGGTLAIGLTLTAAPGFNGTVTFSCVSNQPQFLTCTPAPSSVTLSGNTPKQVAIVMNTFCQGDTPMYGPGPGGFGGGLALLLAMAMLGSITWAYRTRSRWALSFAVLMLIALGSAACSSLPSGPNGRTPAGMYQLNITATAGGASQTVVQPIQVLP
ncbi:MAG TPA: Ig-like domain-containing protein, partial [Candidatus Limnocylindria bacterium]|nr:Ig-like domain-containing protein [Candidatus Limnocylindria bacterium]